MSSHKAVQWTRRWTDFSLSRNSRDDPLFEKLNDVDQDKNDDDEQDNAGFPLPRPDRRQRWRWAPSAALVITGLTIACLLLLITIIFLWRGNQPSNPEETTPAAEGLYHCGNSTSEARALGCEFDMLSYSWTPQECYDRGTAQEFRQWLYEDARKFGPFPFFYDEEGTERVPDETALSESRGRTIHTTQEEHLGHCTFLMRRWHRLTVQRGGSRHINHRFGKFVHTKHCTQRILNVLADPSMLGEETLNSRFGITFEKC